MSKFIVFCGNSPPGPGAIDGGQRIGCAFRGYAESCKEALRFASSRCIELTVL